MQQQPADRLGRQLDDPAPESAWARFTRSLRRFRMAISNTCRWRRHRRREVVDHEEGADALQVTGIWVRAPNQGNVDHLVQHNVTPERPPRPMTLSRARCTPRIPTLLAIEQALDDVKKNVTTAGEKEEEAKKGNIIEIPGDTKPSLQAVERNEEGEDWEVWDMEVEVEGVEEQQIGV